MNARVIVGPWRARTQRRPPTPAYLAAREQIGMTSQGDSLTRKCGWCGADPGEPCRNGATGGKRLPHPSRTETAGTS